MEAGFAVGRWFRGCVSFGLWFPAAELSHRGLPLLPVPVGGLADTTKGVLLRVGHRLCGLCAAFDFLLDDFRLAGGCALDGAGVLARLVCRAGAGVQVKIRPAGRGARSIRLDRAGIFPRRTLFSAVLLAWRWPSVFIRAANSRSSPPWHVWCCVYSNDAGRLAFTLA